MIKNFLKTMKKILFVFFLFLSLWPLNILAHSSGQTIEKQVGEYMFDIGYNSPKINPVAGEALRFDFKIYKGEKKEEVPFTALWTKIARSSEIIFSGRLAKEDFFPTGMLFTFPTGGEYEVTVRFYEADKNLSELTFPLIVTNAMYENKILITKFSNNFIYIAVLIVVFSSLIGYFFVKNRKQNEIADIEK